MGHIIFAFALLATGKLRFLRTCSEVMILHFKVKNCQNPGNNIDISCFQGLLFDSFSIQFKMINNIILFYFILAVRIREQLVQQKVQ